MTRDDLVKLLKHQLGYPRVNLEVTDEDVQSCIEMAILVAKDYLQVRRYKSYPVRRREDMVIPSYSSFIDLKDLEFDIITDVYRGDFITPYIYDQFYLVNYTTRGVPATLASLINMRSNVDALINRSWKLIGKILYLDKFYGNVTIEFIPKTIGLEDIDDEYWISWITRYAKADLKEVLSRIRGKFVVDSNPFKTDAETLANEATAEKAALMEEISNRGYLGVTR